MRKHSALRTAGASRRIQNQRSGNGLGPGGRGGPGRRSGTPSSRPQLEELRSGEWVTEPSGSPPAARPEPAYRGFIDEERGREGGEDLGAFIGFQECVERSNRDVQLPAGEQRHRERPVVSDRERDAVARLDALGLEDRGEGARPTVQLVERERAALPDESGLVRGATRAGLEAANEALRHGVGQAKKSLRLIRCQTSAGTRCRGV